MHRDAKVRLLRRQSEARDSDSRSECPYAHPERLYPGRRERRNRHPDTDNGTDTATDSADLLLARLERRLATSRE